jgi:ABC-type nickel/cobalt efflux system permease component RcnA
VKDFYSTFWIAATLGLLSASPVQAHPILQRVYDRSVVVQLSANAVTIHLDLDVNESTALIDLMAVLDPKDLSNLSARSDVHLAFVRSYAPILADNLVATLDGMPLLFKFIEPRDPKSSVSEEQGHLRFKFKFQSNWKTEKEKKHRFTFREGNYETEAGQVTISHRGDVSVALHDTVLPDESLRNKPAIDRRPIDDDRLRECSTNFVLTGEKPADSEADATSEEAPKPTDLPKKSNDLMDLLFDTKAGFWVLMYLAAFFGAAHALTPGHGKTLVAAYLVGEQGTVWHAILLGLVTTITHTGAVIVLAAALPLILEPKNVQITLQLGGGLIIAAMGIWLFFKRVSGQADHIHIGGHHHHGHSHHHENEYPEKSGNAKVSFGSLFVLGMTGGIVPCWDAILMFALAVASQRLWLGLPLLLAFSAGLACVLIAIGIIVVKAKRLAGSHWGESRLFRALPVLSAVMVTGLGLVLCYQSVH